MSKVMTVCLLICLGCNLVSLASQLYLAFWEKKLEQARRRLEGTSDEINKELEGRK